MLFPKILTTLTIYLSVFASTLSVERGHNLDHQDRGVSAIADDAHLTKRGNPPQNSPPPEIIPQRDAKFNKWLSVGVRMITSKSGSGTIIYYDGSEYAYIQSCGHLWGGTISASQAKRKKLTCNVIVYYHNEKKLEQPKTYLAEVLFYSNLRGQDCSLVRFKPDWKPKYIPIGPEGLEIKRKVWLHSVGCDFGREVGHYYVLNSGENEADLITTDNNPQPGRSGGGLSDENYFVGVCWGSNFRGTGFFTPLRVIRRVNKTNGFGWLNNVPKASLANQIPIIDHESGEKQDDVIPMPQDLTPNPKDSDNGE